MKRCLSSLIALGWLSVLLVGCDPGAVTPTPSTTSIPELAEQYASLEATPEETAFELEPEFRLLTLADFQSFPPDAGI
ncbi:MAG TPA: hypothetical protein VM165_23050, partial [Planctomycetaceae bacterium]|nr:hypothetical protein [Planctomycetaceae bacterium]